MEILLLALICPAIKVVNLSPYAWDREDRRVMMRAKIVCSEDSGYTDTPCLGEFTKKEKRHYTAICTYRRRISND